MHGRERSYGQCCRPVEPCISESEAPEMLLVASSPPLQTHHGSIPCGVLCLRWRSYETLFTMSPTVLPPCSVESYDKQVATTIQFISSHGPWSCRPCPLKTASYGESLPLTCVSNVIFRPSPSTHPACASMLAVCVKGQNFVRRLWHLNQ